MTDARPPVDLTVLFERERPRLRSVAYRLLGSTDDAEDAVQEAWLRLQRADTADIRNPEAWLTTVVARLSLNVLRARKARREDLLDQRLPDPVVEPDVGVAPEETAVAADAVGLALLVVLDTLSPTERLSFVLHDVFDVPFEEIAHVLDKTPEATRQLTSRARRRIRAGSPEPEPDLRRQREVVQAFFAAGQDGDFVRLVELLHPDVVHRADFGSGIRVTRGADAVAGQARLAAGTGRRAHLVTVNGGAGAVIEQQGAPLAVLAFAVTAGRITAIDVLGDPARIAALDLAVTLDR